MLNLKNNQILILGGSLLAIMLIFFLGALVGAKSRVIYSGKNQIIADLEQKLDSKAQKGLIPIISGEERAAASQAKNNLSGRIETAAGDIAAISFDNRYEGGNFFTYLDEPDYFVKKFRINKDTKIIAKQRKNTEAADKELEDYLNKMKAARDKKDFKPEEFALPPSSYLEKEISIKDLKAGAKAVISTANGFNIKDGAEEIAVKIMVEM